MEIMGGRDVADFGWQEERSKFFFFGYPRSNRNSSGGFDGRKGGRGWPPPARFLVGCGGGACPCPNWGVRDGEQ